MLKATKSFIQGLVNKVSTNELRKFLKTDAYLNASEKFQDIVMREIDRRNNETIRKTLCE